MPTILEIIDKQSELMRNANKNYTDIEEWYRYSDSGYVFRSPMNVLARSIGGDNRPGQHNSYVLAQKYCTFLKNENLDMDKINASVNYFSYSFMGIQQITQLSEQQRRDACLEQNIVLIPDRFLDAVHDFKENLGELKFMIDVFTSSTSSANSLSIDFRYLFTRHATSLIEEFDYDSIIVKEACMKAMQERENNFDEPEIDLKMMLELNNSFRSMNNCPRSFSFNEEKNRFVQDPLSEEAKINLLCGFLIKLSPEVIEAFSMIFDDCHYEKSLAMDVLHRAQKTENGQWHPNAFWSKTQAEHHEKFEATLDRIMTL